MSPAKIAMATQVTMAPTAGTGSMKNVTGTSRATAMVAVRPGIDPTNRPKAPAARIANSVSTVNTSARASPNTPIARHQSRRSSGPHGNGTRRTSAKA